MTKLPMIAVNTSHSKAEHKHAIFVLCKIIAQVIADKEDNSIPENVRNSLSDLVKRSENELRAD